MLDLIKLAGMISAILVMIVGFILLTVLEVNILVRFGVPLAIAIGIAVLDDDDDKDDDDDE